MTTQVSPQPAGNADVTTSYAAALASRNAANAQKNGSPSRSTNGSPAPNGVKEDGKKNGNRKESRKGSAAKENKEEVNGHAGDKDEEKEVEKKEFVPAPPPKVNVWKVRQEEKSKAVPVSTQTAEKTEKKDEGKKDGVEQKEKKEEGKKTAGGGVRDVDLDGRANRTV